MRRAVTVIGLLACVGACGRCGYDPLRGGAGFDGSAGRDGAVAHADGDVAGLDGAVARDGSSPIDAMDRVDGSGSTFAGTPCRFLSTPSCPNSAPFTLSGFGLSSIGAGTNSSGNFIAGSCGGAGAEETSHEVRFFADGHWRFTVMGSDVDTVMYLLADDCAGAELACAPGRAPGGPVLEVDALDGDLLVLVVDGQGDRCGSYSIVAERTR